MRKTFAEVVEAVKQLSHAEKEELQALLRRYVVEERAPVHCRSGSAKGQLAMSDDFDKPLEDFAENME
jgi:hypothetical protein